MSYQEIAKTMIDKMSGIDIYPEYAPNAETLAAFAEGHEMLANGTGQKFTNTKDLFAALEE